MINIPNEILVCFLSHFSTLELCQFRPPNRRFQQVWKNALATKEKLSSAFRLGKEIKKQLSEEYSISLETTEYGGILPALIALAVVPEVSLSNDEQNEAIPHPNIDRFKDGPIVTGITKLNRRFLSILLKDENNQIFPWTIYQMWVGEKKNYWKVLSDKEPTFVTKEVLNNLAKSLLTHHTVS